MKKVLLLMGVLLTLGLFCACSNSNESSIEEGLQPGDIVCVYGDVKAVYEPISYQNTPEQIKGVLEERGKLNTYLYQGKRNGATIYLLRTAFDSSIGNFFDENWERVTIDTDYTSFFSETSNWKLIFYNK